MSATSTRKSRKQILARFARNEKIFPGGEHETGYCTACAQIITARFGGEVRGYYHDDNMTAGVGEVEGGHDFAITSDRFLVDPWLFHYYEQSPVLDLTIATDRCEALKRYGPEERWSRDDPPHPPAHQSKARLSRLYDPA
jgi:hypothetical protein